MFAYPCPSCAQRLIAPPDRVGQQTVCPKCLRPLTVPAPDAVGIDTLSATVATPLPVATWESVAVTEAVAVGAAVGEIDFGPTVALEVAPLPDLRTARPNSGPTSRKSLADAECGRVILNPTGLFAVDIAAELSAAISMRMAPPPEPLSDRQLTLAAWLAGTAVAGLLWLIAVVTAPDLFPFVALLGGSMVAFGWLWRAYLAGRSGHPASGLVTLLPPVAAVRLFVPTPAHGLRPLRFVLAGAVFLGLFVLGPAVRSVFEGEFGARVDDFPLSVSTTPAARLQKAVAGKKFDDALAELRTLPRPNGVADADRPGTLRDLIALTTADRADLRTAALTALADWSATDAKPAVRAGLTATDTEERLAACKVADRVLGEESAALLAACLADRNDRAEAKAALIRLVAVAESAVLPLLKSDREPVLLAACEVLERVGGAKAAAALTELAEATKSRAVRQEASQAAEAVAERVRKAK